MSDRLEQLLREADSAAVTEPQADVARVVRRRLSDQRRRRTIASGVGAALVAIVIAVLAVQQHQPAAPIAQNPAPVQPPARPQQIDDLIAEAELHERVADALLAARAPRPAPPAPSASDVRMERDRAALM